MHVAAVGWRGAGTIFGGAAGVGSGRGTRVTIGIVCGRLRGQRSGGYLEEEELEPLDPEEEELELRNGKKKELESP